MEGGYFSSILIVIVGVFFIKDDARDIQKNCRRHMGLENLNVLIDTGESDAKFVVNRENTVAFSQNIDGKYRVSSFNDLTNEYKSIVKDDLANIKNPFVLDGRFCALKETGSAKTLALPNGNFPESCRSKLIEMVSSSGDGQTIIVKFEDSDSIFIASRQSRQLRYLLVINGNLESISFSTDGNAIINTSGGIFFYDRLAKKATSLDIPLDGEKLNASLYKDNIYFANSRYSNYYEIFGYNISSAKLAKIKLGDFDHKLPRRVGNKIYYIKVDRSQYLLECFDLVSKESQTLVSTGVVYDYHVSGDKIYFTYSDMVTPRCLKIYNTRTKITQDISCSKHEPTVREIFSRSPGTSPGYILEPLRKEAIRGILLYFHPLGTNNDYSPRWDNMITPFCANGYAIVAPNFPSSGGYGKQHSQRSRADAVEDLVKWKRKIETLYPNKPIFYYGISSGCVLMEAVLMREPVRVAGVVSAFGLEPLELKHDIPSIFILGEKDLLIPFGQRVHQLRLAQAKHITTLRDEAHWIQNEAGFIQYYSEVFAFLDDLTSTNFLPNLF